MKKLTETYLKSLKPQPKPYKSLRESGLFVWVRPNGTKWWRLSYSFGGKEKLLSLGVYPDVSLADARERRDEARKLLARGVNPSAQRKAEKAAGEERAANSFEVIAREWFAKFSTRWAPSHAGKTIGRLERDVFPWIGERPIAEVSASELLAVLRRVEGRGALETAHRILQVSGQIFRYAVATSRAERDPSQDLRGALAPWKPEHYPTLTEPTAIGELLRAIDGYTGGYATKCALQLAPMLFARPGELRRMEWAELDLDAGMWSIPAAKMKTREPHLVPLSAQAVAILRDLYPLTGRGQYVFPGGHNRRRPMSENALNSALRRLGYDKHTMTMHGWRATARTLLDETLGYRPDFIEHQLAHAVRDPNGRAYNRTSHLNHRKAMMQGWADYLDSLKADRRKVVTLRAA